MICNITWTAARGHPSSISLVAVLMEVAVALVLCELQILPPPAATNPAVSQVRRHILLIIIIIIIIIITLFTSRK